MNINQTQKKGSNLIIGALAAFYVLYLQLKIGWYFNIIGLLIILISIALIVVGLQKIDLIGIIKCASQNLKEEDTVKGNANPRYIAVAGKELKKIVYAVLFMLVISLLASAIIPFLRISALVGAYFIVGVIVLLCNIFIVICLHRAGDNLEKAGTQ